MGLVERFERFNVKWVLNAVNECGSDDWGQLVGYVWLKKWGGEYVGSEVLLIVRPCAVFSFPLKTGYFCVSKVTKTPGGRRARISVRLSALRLRLAQTPRAGYALVTHACRDASIALPDGGPANPRPPKRNGEAEETERMVGIGSAISRFFVSLGVRGFMQAPKSKAKCREAAELFDERSEELFRRRHFAAVMRKQACITPGGFQPLLTRKRGKS